MVRQSWVKVTGRPLSTTAQSSGCLRLWQAEEAAQHAQQRPLVIAQHGDGILVTDGRKITQGANHRQQILAKGGRATVSPSVVAQSKQRWSTAAQRAARFL